MKVPSTYKNFTAALVLVFALVESQSALALSTDRDQPAEIEADDIEFDFTTGKRIYLDNVLVVQGTLRLKADKVIAIYKGKDLDTATAWGSLARFKQRPDGKEHDVEGWAKKIIVDQKANTLTLIGQAALKQGPDTARGQTIVYNMATDTLKLKGGAKVGAAGKGGKQVPKRKLEDPFADDGQAAGPAAPKKSKAKKPAEKADTADATATQDQSDSEPAENEAEQTTQPEPVKSGRSRLIIQPK